MKLGIIGMNSGNGHPYSYSAIFNGYDPIALQKNCPFELIKKYLPDEHKNINGIDGAKVTHIWTQDRQISKNIAEVSLIPHIVDKFEDLANLVDGVIIARDDIENHRFFAEPFVEKGVPLFIDKQLARSSSDLKYFEEKCILTNYPLMACSAIRFNNKIKLWENKGDQISPIGIQGVSRVNWIRYAHHLLEGIVMIFGLDIEMVQCIHQSTEHEAYFLKYYNGTTVYLEFSDSMKLPIRFIVHSKNQDHMEFHFDQFFQSFKAMLVEFMELVKRNKPLSWFHDMFLLSKIVLAGEVSRHNGGRAVYLSDFLK